MTTLTDPTLDISSNIVHLEHVNVTQPDQRLATLFYVIGLGLTRDPYLMVGLDNMWINIGRSQMHLPTGAPQQVRGTIGLVVPDLDALKHRLGKVARHLSGTQFLFSDGAQCVDVTCPWGNRFRCHAPEPDFGHTELAMPYVEFAVPEGSASAIARFYRELLGAAGETISREGSVIGRVSTGKDQYFFFRETGGAIRPYDGHHVAVYIADFAGPYRRMLERSLITREMDAHEWRFQQIVDVDSNEVLFELEHEVRSLKHPLYARPLVNRNPAQTNSGYVRGKDAFTGTF
jgi:hypothetical protein